MTLARRETWYTQANYDFPDVTTATLVSKSFAWMLKDLLTSSAHGSNGPEGTPPAGSLWTVEGSSDGVTGAMDNVDRLGVGTFNASKYIVAADGVNHSWICLKSPAAMGPLYMVINGPLTADEVTLSFSTSAPTAGTAAYAPVSAVGWSQNFNGTSRSQVNVGSTNAQRMHLTRNAAGSFYMLTSRNGSGWFHTLFACVKLADAVSNDQCPYTTFFGFRDDAKIGDWYNTFASGNCGAYSRTYNLGAQTFNMPCGQVQGFLGLNGTDGTLNAGNTDGSQSALPMYTAYFNSPYSGLKGRWPDAYQLASRIAPGSMVPASSPYLFTGLYGTLLPFSVAPVV